MTPAKIHSWILDRLRVISPDTITVCLSVLSQLLEHAKREGLATVNPCRGLPAETRRLMRSRFDPTQTPFLERVDDIRRVFRALPPPLHVGFALGALAGLRPVEAFSLRWGSVDLETRRLLVRKEVAKDKEPRVVPITGDLLPVLKAWKLETGGVGLVCPPMRKDGEKVDKGTRGDGLRAALAELQLARPGLGWYECTRHTFASHWVLSGRSIEKLSKLLGHYSVVMTERYAHLRPDLYTEHDLAGFGLELGEKTGSAPVRSLRKS